MLAATTDNSDRSGREACRAQIIDIEKRIFHLNTAIRALRSEQDLIQKQLDDYKYLVLTLPNEIVSEIFIHFLPVYPLCPPQTGLLSPTLLTHICRKWREIALSTPALWRAILLCDDEKIDYEEQQVHTLKIWLSRSGCCPLSNQMEDFDSIPMDECIEAIAPHRARLEHAKLQMTRYGIHTIQGPMPLLRQISIRLPYESVPSCMAFCDVPRLRAATLWDSQFTEDLLPWSQLTSLTLVAKTPSECTPILKEVVNLVHCKLFTSEEVHVRQPDISLPFLESLVFVQFVDEEDPAIHYLDTFIVPALRRLQIPETFLAPRPIDALRAFISKSGCNLQEILITGGRTLRKKFYCREFSSIEFSFSAVITDSYCDGEPDSPDVKPFYDGDWYPEQFLPVDHI
ncbi:hypothetical protein B0H11DRAFT_1893106 [Mycena galericulata]|nr:hypothetical protein B0H11DRAFT_1893106 [Mycena galericulata]